jgi:predicted ATPase
VDAALALAEQTRERWMNAELWRLRGCIVLRLGSSGEKDAEACFSHALACADAQQSKMLALRAATSLAGLWERQRLRGKAREFLAAHYNSVAEGLDTPDMTEARSLLDALQ